MAINVWPTYSCLLWGPQMHKKCTKELKQETKGTVMERTPGWNQAECFILLNQFGWGDYSKKYIVYTFSTDHKQEV